MTSKRGATFTAAERPAKRVKTSDTFSEDARRTISAIQDGSTDRTGFLSVKCCMAWPASSTKLRFNAQTIGEGEQYRFDVVLSGACTKYFNPEQLQFRPNDELYLALRGVRVEKINKSSGRGSLPLVLHYDDGVAVQYIKSAKRNDLPQTVDTWELDETPKELPPKLPSVRPVANPNSAVVSSRAEAPRSALQKAPGKTNARSSPQLATALPSTSLPPPRPTSTTTSNIAKAEVSAPQAQRPPPSVVPGTAGPSHTSNGRQAPAALSTFGAATHSKSSGLQTPPEEPMDHRSLQQISVKPPSSIPKESRAPEPHLSKVVRTSGAENPQPKLSRKQEKKLKKQQKKAANRDIATTEPSHVVCPPGKAAVADNTPPTNGSPAPMVPPVAQASAENPPGIAFQTSQGDRFTLLNALEARRWYHLIGVVVQAKPPSQSRTGEWFNTIRLVDPTKYNADPYSNATEGFSFTCFARYVEWLPRPSQGDVLLIKNLYTDERKGPLGGTGRNGQFWWAIYTPSTGKIHHGDAGLGPGGAGARFDPCYHPGPEAIPHCVRLADWWSQVQQERETARGNIVQIGAVVNRLERQHRLISEAGPQVPPRGFFDCTVEVLRTRVNPSRSDVWDVFVTDYTANEGLFPCYEWAPRSLESRVLQIEMWKNATDVGKRMAAGELYAISNARMKNDGRIIVGTISEGQKISKLDADSVASKPNLQALLERKARFENETASTAFGHLLISEMNGDVFATCTVEVLHVVQGHSTPNVIFVTDYTVNPDLPIISSAEPWASDRQQQIVRVALWDGQAAMASTVEVGSYYKICNLRLVRRHILNGEVEGRLGGDDRLIFRLKEDNTSNEHLVALLQRKAQWEADRRRKHQPIDPVKRRGTSTLREILDCPSETRRFWVIAHVTDLSPLDFRDFVVQMCSKCGNDIPQNRQACLDCDDYDKEYVRHQYRFGLTLTDEEGTDLDVTVSDDAPLLAGFEPRNLYDDSAALDALIRRLSPFLGNLSDVQQALSRSKQIKPMTPMMRFAIDRWTIDPAQGARYSLVHFDAPH